MRFPLFKMNTTKKERPGPQPGFYRVDDDIYRVQTTHAGTWYATKAVLRGSRVEWRYVGHRVRITADGTCITTDNFDEVMLGFA
jgi:hypothetical protein